MSYIRNAEYSAERERPKLLMHYVDQMVQYLSLRYPHKSLEQITDFVKKTVKDRVIAPKIKAVYHKSEGNSEVIIVSLTAFIKDILKDNNLSPSGSVYMPVSKKVSYLRTSLEEKVADRNKFKSMMFEH